LPARRTYEGGQALKETHDEGSIVLYAMAIIAKEPNDRVAVKQAADPLDRTILPIPP